MKIFLTILKWLLILGLAVQLTLTLSLFSSGYEIATQRLIYVSRDIAILLALLGGVIYWKRKIN